MNENPCDECLIKTICVNMCERAKPYFNSMVVTDKNFDWSSYLKRSDELFQKKYREASSESEKETIQEVFGIK